MFMAFSWVCLLSSVESCLGVVCIQMYSEPEIGLELDKHMTVI